mgnify:CR=1 FL=1
MPSIARKVGSYHGSMERVRCQTVKEFVTREILPRFKQNANRSWNHIDQLSQKDPFSAQHFLIENRFYCTSIAVIEEFLRTPVLTSEFLILETTVLTTYDKLISHELSSMRNIHDLIETEALV